MKKMMSTILLPEELRPLLKSPLGRLFSNVRDLVDKIREKPPKLLISVGDRVTMEIISKGVMPDLAIIDLREMRKPVSPRMKSALLSRAKHVIRVKNPAGSLTPALFSAICGAERGTVIKVEGEEDLATLPAIALSPAGSCVVYGQPGEGLVLVRVTGNKKREILNIIKKFKGKPIGDRKR